MKELKKQWKEHQFHKCYLFYGTETYLMKNYEEALVQALLPPGTESMNSDILEGKKATAATIMDAAETLPFLNDKRLVLIRNSEFFHRNGRKEEGERLVEFLKDSPESTCILFVEEKAEKTGKLYKTIAKEGQVVEFAPLKEKEIITWLRKTCASGGVQLSEAMSVLLLRTTDNSMENLQREMDKLIAYKDGTGEITQEDISAVCSVSLEAKVFELVRAMGEKKTEKAISIYSNLLSLKESPYMVLSLLTRQFRMILGSALLSAEGAAQAEIASRLEVRDFAVRDYLRQSKSFSIKELEQALADCLETDLDIKSGRIAEDLAVELLLVKYSSPSFS
ncbi:DNA polymerase III subunit delta [Anaerotignum lactatifermentans]